MGALRPGESVYTGLLNERGGYESDATVHCVGKREFLIVSPTAQATRDLDWLSHAIDRAAVHLKVPAPAIVDITSALAVLSVQGPGTPALLRRVSPYAHTRRSLAYLRHRTIDIGIVQARVVRVSFVGECGVELYIPSDMAHAAYAALIEAAAVDQSYETTLLCDVGYYAIDSMRIEKGYRAWGAELTPDVTPLEAGLAFTCDFSGDFLGRTALLRQRESKVLHQRVVSLSLDFTANDDPSLALWGEEAVLRNGHVVGYVTSAAYGHRVDRHVALAVLRVDADAGGEGGLSREWLRTGSFSLDLGGGRQVPVEVSLNGVYGDSDARSSPIDV